jgi:hypothetical protein
MFAKFLVVFATLLCANAFQSGAFMKVRSLSRTLEMAKKSVGDLTEADLKGKRYIES